MMVAMLSREYVENEVKRDIHAVLWNTQMFIIIIFISYFLLSWSGLIAN